MADFDLKKLERELETAVEVEEKRQRVDDCKKKAIHSTASYEEFRQRVLAVDLKPVSSKEFEGAFHRKKGDRVARNRALHRIDRTATSRKAVAAREFEPSGVPAQPPKNIMEFGREWRRNCRNTEAQYRYFRLLTAKKVAKVFKNELDSAVFAQIIGALAEQLPSAPGVPTPTTEAGVASVGAGAGEAAGDGGAGTAVNDEAGTAGSAGQGAKDAAWAFKVLQAFAGGTRFTLTMKLMGDKDREALGVLFDKLLGWASAFARGVGTDAKRKLVNDATVTQLREVFLPGLK